MKPATPDLYHLPLLKWEDRETFDGKKGLLAYGRAGEFHYQITGAEGGGRYLDAFMGYPGNLSAPTMSQCRQKCQEHFISRLKLALVLPLP